MKLDNKYSNDKLSKFAKSWFFFRLVVATLVVLLAVLIFVHPNKEVGDKNYCSRRVQQIYAAALVGPDVLSKTFDECMSRNSSYQNPYNPNE